MVHGQALPKAEMGQLASRGSYWVCDGSLSRPGQRLSRNFLEPVFGPSGYIVTEFRRTTSQPHTYFKSSYLYLHIFTSIDLSQKVAHLLRPKTRLQGSFINWLSATYPYTQDTNPPIDWSRTPPASCTSGHLATYRFGAPALWELYEAMSLYSLASDLFADMDKVRAAAESGNTTKMHQRRIPNKGPTRPQLRAFANEGEPLPGLSVQQNDNRKEPPTLELLEGCLLDVQKVIHCMLFTISLSPYRRRGNMIDRALSWKIPVQGLDLVAYIEQRASAMPAC